MEIDFNKALYRTIQTGYQYEKLIPGYKKEIHHFEKHDEESDVYDTLKFMAQWSNKYAWQMKMIAPLLVGINIEETVRNVYKFVYSHYQYKIDEELQYLYSPAAAWYYRRTGIDCKSFSIIASTILKCLGIPHSFRMVKQKGVINPRTNQWIIDPNKWTHVYVIVPNKNNYFVIDATTHTNKEVEFVQKHDHQMKHVGLNSPAPSQIYGLSCACSGSALTKGQLGNPYQLANAVKNFHSFLDKLISS